MRPTKILYIEDNDQNFYLVDFILKAKGYSVIRAVDGREGLEMAETVRPDMILMDIQLPVMDGYATAKELRQRSLTQRTPIVALTSYAMPGEPGEGHGSWMQRVYRETDRSPFLRR